MSVKQRVNQLEKATDGERRYHVIMATNGRNKKEALAEFCATHGVEIQRNDMVIYIVQ